MSAITPTDGWTLRAARDWLRGQLDDGSACPCCNQFAKIYRRKITSQTARALVLMYAAGSQDWHYFPELLGRKQADEAKARYWGLIEESGETREDGSRRAGMWRLTNLGRSFVRGHCSIAKYARIYDGRCYGIDDTETVDIHEALGTKFNYDDLMAGQ